MVATLNEIAAFEDALKPSDDKGNGYAVCQTSGPPWLVWLEIGAPVSAGYTAPWASVDHIMKKHKYNRTWQNKRTHLIEATSGVIDHEELVSDWFDEESWRLLRQSAWAEMHQEHKSIGSGAQEMIGRDPNQLLLTDGSYPEHAIMEVHRQDKAHSEPDVSGIPSSAPVRLRLLITTTRQDRYRFTRNVMQILAEHLNLSLDHLKWLNGSSYAPDIVTWSDGQRESCLVRLHESAGKALPIITCHHNFETNVTLGLVVIHDVPSPGFVENLVSCIVKRCNLAEDPFMAPLALADCLASGYLHYLGSMQQYISDMRVIDLGLNSRGRDPLESDFISCLKTLDKLQLDVAVQRDIINHNMLVIKKLNNLSFTHFRTINNIADARRTPRRPRFLDTYTEELKDDHQNLLSALERNEGNVRSIQQLVSNFMAIKESRVNGELAKSSMMIAEATMKDSSAMKSIAVLTMIFLPATAVAAIFDTPFFEWTEDGNRSKLMTKNFSTYWQISVPLTVGLMLLWFLIVRPEKEWHDKVKQRYLGWREEGMLAKWRDYVSGDPDEEESISRRRRRRSRTRKGPRGYITNGEEDFVRVPVRSSTMRSMDTTYGGHDIRGYIMDRAWHESPVHAVLSRIPTHTADEFELGHVPEEGRANAQRRSPSRERRRPGGTRVVTQPQGRPRSGSRERRRPDASIDTTRNWDSTDQSFRGRQPRRNRRRKGLP